MLGIDQLIGNMERSHTGLYFPFKVLEVRGRLAQMSLEKTKTNFPLMKNP